MIFFFFISNVLPFRDLRISLSFKGRISFLKPLLTSLLRFSILFLFKMLYLFFVCLFFSPSLHAFSPKSRILPQSRTQPSTHNSSVHSLAHATRAAGLLAPPTRGRGWCPVGAFRWRRWTWLLSTESRHSYTMGPFTHMSDSVADWGRGTWRVAPSLVGGPQNCDGSWFISVHNYSYIRFCICCIKISWFRIFGCPWFSPGRHRVFLLSFEVVFRRRQLQ